MKKNNYIILSFIVLSAFYGCYSTINMLFNNRTPYSLATEGLLLNKNKIYSIANIKRTSNDTIFLHFDNSSSVMPPTLGYIQYSKQSKEFVFINGSCVINPNAKENQNPFFPYCHTIRNGFLKNGKYFSSKEIIPQDVLLKDGIKFNVASGSSETRVAIEIIKFNNELYLKIKDDGLKVKYPVPSNQTTSYEVLFNRRSHSKVSYVFSFSNTADTIGAYTIKITPTFLNASYEVVNDNNNIIKAGAGATDRFTIGKCLFHISKKYSLAFSLFFVSFLFSLIIFQLIFFAKYNHTQSPIIKSLFAIRLMINAMVLMAVPLFLTSYPIHDNRIWYLLLVLVLNIYYFAYFIPLKDFFLKSNAIKSIRNFFIKKFSKYFTYLLWLLVFIAPIAMWKFASNEAIFQIPIGHFQKVLIIILYYITNNLFKTKRGWDNFFRLFIISIYSLIISLVTSDIGSFIYVTLAILIIELVRKTIQLKWIFILLPVIILIITIVINTKPNLLQDRKIYRIVAPYIQPDNEILAAANEGDRESNAIFNLTLKGILNGSLTGFNNFNLPANAKSTFHTDFAFLWAFAFGHLAFLVLYLAISGYLIYSLLFLIYLSIRQCKINADLAFTFPTSKEAESVRFLLSFTFISFIVPICSNLLLIPITGVSIPAFSISWVEIIFIIILIFAMENIFNTTKYYAPIKTYPYHYSDLRKSVRWGLHVLAICFVAATITKIVIFSFFTSDNLTWKKQLISDSKYRLNAIPKDKDGIISLAKNIIDNDNISTVKKEKKNALKNLSCIYFTNKPYNESSREQSDFKTSIKKLKGSMILDSLLTFNNYQISAGHAPFGNVSVFQQLLNGKLKSNVSNNYYTGFEFGSTSINADLHAECTEALQEHIKNIGNASNIGSVMIIDNKTGGILASSSYPFDRDMNAKDVYYFIGSLKKVILAYAALKIDANYAGKEFSGVRFGDFIKKSSDKYAAGLLKDILQNHKSEFEKVLKEDFNLPLYNDLGDAYLDKEPETIDFVNALDKRNVIYRSAIGQQTPYPFQEVMQWYGRIAIMKKLILSYDGNPNVPAISINEKSYNVLRAAMNSVLQPYGTASSVGNALKIHGISTQSFICKTGTAEAPNGLYNVSSSFIICNSEYSIGIMLKGNIPFNDEKLAAKDLFISIIPILIKYKII